MVLSWSVTIIDSLQHKQLRKDKSNQSYTGRQAVTQQNDDQQNKARPTFHRTGRFGRQAAEDEQIEMIDCKASLC